MPDQPHAIKITSFLPTFLRVKSPLSIIRWLPIDEIKERGLGYFKYKVGDLQYETDIDDIHVKWDAISKDKDTNTTVMGIRYRIYISDNLANLKSASSCEKFLPEDVLVIEVNIPKDELVDADLSHYIEVQYIFNLEKYDWKEIQRKKREYLHERSR